MTTTQTSPVDVFFEDPPRKRSVGRIIGISVFSLLAGIVVIALIAAGFLAWTVQRSFPQLDGTIGVDGLTNKVEVQRDAQGVATITANTSRDLFLAQGYVHAQDRFWEMDFRRHVTSGRLSELFGASQLDTDRFLRTLGWRAVAEQEVELLDDTVRGYYEAYAEGVNAWLADHQGAEASLEYAVLGLQNPDYEIEPWTVADSLAWLKAMAWDLRENLDSETERALLAQEHTPEQIAELFPQYPFDRNPTIVPVPKSAQTASADVKTEAGATTASIAWTEVGSVVEAASALLGTAGEGVGSNSWVVSGDLTESGLPLLANDPHLGAALPSIWHQVDLKCRVVTETCPFDVAGFGFSGVPGVIIGHNAHLAWGFTNLTTDVTDLYIEAVDGDSYWRDGALVPLEVRNETISVAGGDDVDLEIRSTVHGPIISGLTDDMTAVAEDYVIEGAPAGAEYAVALQWTALQPGTTAASIFALDVAKDWEGFQAAAALFDVPAQNLIYADTAGNIGYQTPGKLPIRGAGDGSYPQPGWDSAYDWTGFIPFDELPSVTNPSQGYIVTANNAIVGPDYEHFLTNDWDYGWRAARIATLIQRKVAEGKLTAESMREIQADKGFWMGVQLAAAYKDVTVSDEKAAEAVDLLRAWDGQNSADSPAAAYANVLWDTLAVRLFGDAGAPLTNQGRLFLVVDTLLDQPDSPWWADAGGSRDAVLAEVAVDAYERLVELQGEKAQGWNWGSLHALTLTSGTFGSSGIAPIEWLFNRGPFPVGGGSSVVDATGWVVGESFETVTVPSMRMIVDLSDFDLSSWNHLTGNSGHAFHPNYIDQTDDWAHAQLSPWPFSRAAVKAAAAHTLVLEPAA
ncbi:MAG TPA: penicillin acylase family protein [Microbacterium sp.]|nr:penicillin acylase family protein [Microbacterium sp.]